MDHTPKGMKKKNHIHQKNIIVAYVPKSNVKRCFSELFQDEMSCDAWLLMNQEKIEKIVEVKVREIFIQTFTQEGEET